MAPPSVNLPGLEPPPGHTPNFDHPWSIQTTLNGYLGFSIAVTTITLAARLYTRFWISRTGSWDDCLMVAGWALLTTQCAIAFRMEAFGAGIHQWDVPLSSIQEFVHMTFIAQLLYTIAHGFIKVSVCIQLVRIFVPTRRGFEFWAISTFILVQILWFFTMFWLAFFECVPIQRFWTPQGAGKCLPAWRAIYAVTGIVNLVSDIAILVYPLARLSRLQLSRDKKFWARVVLSIGFAAIVASLMRVIISVVEYSHFDDETFVLIQMYLCIIAEMTAGVIAGNSVSMPHLIAHFKHKWTSTRIDRRKVSQVSSTDHSELDGMTEVGRISSISEPMRAARL